MNLHYWQWLHLYQNPISRRQYFTGWLYLLTIELAWFLIWVLAESVLIHGDPFLLVFVYVIGLALILPPFLSLQAGRLINAGWPKALAITFNALSYAGSIVCPPLLVSNLGGSSLVIAGAMFLLVWLYSFLIGIANLVMLIFACLPTKP